MNTTTNHEPATAGLSKLRIGILMAGMLCGLTACSTTRQLSSDHQSGFLGDYSMLRKGTGNEANYVYVNTNINWAKFKKIWIKPIELWASDDANSPMGKLSEEKQKTLISYLHNAVKETFETEYQIVDQDGPDVLVIHAAITDAKQSKPVANLITSAYLPLKIISFGKRLATGADMAVGSVYVEAEFLDGQTGQRIGAGTDARVGTKALQSKFGGTWGDVKLAFDWWAQRAAVRLVLLQAGDTTSKRL